MAGLFYLFPLEWTVMELKDKLQKVYNKIAQAKNILVVGHIHPDADALSSIGAILEIADRLNIKTYAYADGQALDSYGFIPQIEKVTYKPPENLLEFDLIIVLDCGAMSRTNLADRLTNLLKKKKQGTIATRPYIIELDHHQPQDSYADLEIRLPDKASTTEIIYHLIKANNLDFSRTLADCILIGLMTDTGHFLHANSSPEAMAIASEMLLRGASLPKIISYTVNNKSFASLKVWGRALENMRFNEKTGLVSSALTTADLTEILSPQEIKSGEDLFADIVSFLITLQGAKVALFLREEGGLVRGSLRTNSDLIDVAKIARIWGGGGHKKAAGFSLPGRLKRTTDGFKVIKQNKDIKKN